MFNEETISWLKAHEQQVSKKDIFNHRTVRESADHPVRLTTYELMAIIELRAETQMQMQVDSSLDWDESSDRIGDYVAGRMDALAEPLGMSVGRRIAAAAYERRRRRLGERGWQALVSECGKAKSEFLAELQAASICGYRVEHELLPLVVEALPDPRSFEIAYAFKVVAIELFDGVPQLADVEPLVTANTLDRVRDETHRWAKQNGIPLDRNLACQLLVATDHERVEAIRLPGLDFEPTPDCEFEDEFEDEFENRFEKELAEEWEEISEEGMEEGF